MKKTIVLIFTVVLMCLTLGALTACSGSEHIGEYFAYSGGDKLEHSLVLEKDTWSYAGGTGSLEVSDGKIIGYKDGAIYFEGTIENGIFSVVMGGFSTAFYADGVAPPLPSEYTIQYTHDGGTESLQVRSNDVYAIPVIPEKEGYEFLGLFDSASGGTQFVDASGSGLSVFTDNKNMVLFPQYSPKEYTLQLDFQGAPVEGSRAFKVKYDSSFALPTSLTLANKVFTGWYTEENRGGTQIADEYGVLPEYETLNNSWYDISSNSLRLYAGFKGEEYLVTLYPATGGNPEEVLVEHGTYASDIVCEKRVNGKAVYSWTKTSGSTEVFDGKIVGETILYAIEYAPVIDFDTDGGEEINPLVANAGNGIELPTPKRKNYVFGGWKNASGTIMSFSTMPSDSMTLTAIWKPQVVFNTRGGTEVNNISQNTGTSVTLPTTEKSGYIFAGWYEENGEKYEATSMPENSIELKAMWYEIKDDLVVVAGEGGKIWGSRDTPSVINDRFKMDVTKYIDAGVHEINVKIHYESYIDPGYGHSYPKHTYMNWYTEDSTSSANCVWTYGEKHMSGEWSTYDRASKIKLTSKVVYICWYVEEIFNGSGQWKDFYIEIEYPDTSKLY